MKSSDFFFHIKKLPSERYTNPAPEANSGFLNGVEVTLRILNGVEVTLRGEIPKIHTMLQSEFCFQLNKIDDFILEIVLTLGELG